MERHLFGRAAIATCLFLAIGCSGKLDDTSGGDGTQQSGLGGDDKSDGDAANANDEAKTDPCKGDPKGGGKPPPGWKGDPADPKGGGKPPPEWKGDPGDPKAGGPPPEWKGDPGANDPKPDWKPPPPPAKDPPNDKEPPNADGKKPPPPGKPIIPCRDEPPKPGKPPPPAVELCTGAVIGDGTSCISDVDLKTKAVAICESQKAELRSIYVGGHCEGGVTIAKFECCAPGANEGEPLPPKGDPGVPPPKK
jgi:hypothetical protein